MRELQKLALVYPCFCSFEELERKRERQLLLKQPPRYDRACLKISFEEREQKIKAGVPFIWRFKLPDGVIQIRDMAHGLVTFDFKNFSDFALTRSDGSFTFIFANFVDDLVMEITHVIRGEDHLTNTANQSALYKAFNKDIPTFWHLPIICNAEGKKLSKRDFGFSLGDLRQAGYIAEAINNYLAILGTSFDQEIMSLEDLAHALRFESLTSASQIRYDPEKLRWVNHKWLNKLDPMVIAQRSLVFLLEAYPEAKSLSLEKLSSMIRLIQPDLFTLRDVSKALQFYFEQPIVTKDELSLSCSERIKPELIKLFDQLKLYQEHEDRLVAIVNGYPKASGISAKDFFTMIRLVLIGKTEGPRIKDIISIIGTQEALSRLQRAISEYT